MKKIILLLALVAGITTTSMAQRLRIGPEIGVNLSNMSYYDDFGLVGDDRRGTYDAKAGLRIGGVIDARVTRHFAIQPGLFYNQKGFRNNGRGDDFTIRVNYIEMPLYFHYVAGTGYGGSFFIGGGPYLAGVVGGTIINRDDDEDFDLEVGDRFGRDDVRGGDAGLNFDLGFQGRYGFFFRANAGLGLANIQPDGDDDLSLRNHTLSLSIGWLIGPHPAHRGHGHHHR